MNTVSIDCNDRVSLVDKKIVQSIKQFMESTSCARANTLKVRQAKQILLMSCSGCVLYDSVVTKEELRSRLGVSKNFFYNNIKYEPVNVDTYQISNRKKRESKLGSIQ